MTLDGERVRCTDIANRRQYLYFEVAEELAAPLRDHQALVAVECRILPRLERDLPTPGVRLRYDAQQDPFPFARPSVHNVAIGGDWQWLTFELSDIVFRRRTNSGDLRISCNHPGTETELDLAVRRLVLLPLTV